MSVSFDQLLQNVQSDPQNAENWVLLILESIRLEDFDSLSEIFRLRDQIFNDAGILLFQALYSEYAQRDPTLQQKILHMGEERDIYGDLDLVLVFFSGCLQMIDGARSEGLDNWSKVIRAMPQYGQKLLIIPQLTELVALRELYTDADICAPSSPVNINWLVEPSGTDLAKESPVFFAACDGRYFRQFGDKFLQQLSRQGDIHLHIAEPDEEGLKKLKALETHGITITYENKSDRRSSPYFACMRFLHAPEIQDKLQRDLVILDVDLEEVQVLDPLIERSRRGDVALFDTGLIMPWLRHQAAYLYVKNNDKARGFLTRLADLLYQKLPESRWFIDQAALLRILKETDPSEVTFEVLDPDSGLQFEDFFSSSGTTEEKRAVRLVNDGGRIERY